MTGSDPGALKLGKGDALIIVDVQKDFLPGGSLAVPHGEEVVLAANRYIEKAQSEGLPIYITRDWHPPGHCSFKEKGGPWPPHCIAGTVGAEFADALRVPTSATVISKGTKLEEDAYSAFQGTDLDNRLLATGIIRLLIGGLATDYCVLNTVKDAVRLGYKVLLLEDAVRAVNVQIEDGKKATEEMTGLGVIPATFALLEKSG